MWQDPDVVLLLGFPSMIPVKLRVIPLQSIAVRSFIKHQVLIQILNLAKQSFSIECDGQ